MKFPEPLVEGRLIRRYKRFLADVRLDNGETITVHCANTGSMKNCLVEESPCWISLTDKPGRKLPGTLEMITTTNGHRAGVNTSRPNHLVREGIENGVIAELQGYDSIRTEVKYGEQNSRIDLLLEKDDSRCYVEVKNVTVRELVPLLRQLSDQAGAGNVTNYDPANVIMLTGTAATVSRLVNIIERVDKAGDQDVEIIKLSYASAGEMVRIIESMYQPSGGKAGQPTFLIPKIVADDRSNSVIVSGEIKARERVARLIKRLDSELETSGNTRVYYLKYAKSEDLVKVLNGVSKTIASEENAARAGSKSNKAAVTSIEAHESTNTLVITGQPDMLRSLEGVIRQLDTPRAQVHIEAIIVEVFETDGVQLGVQWYNEQGAFTQFTNGPVPVSSLAAGVKAAEGEKASQTIITNPDGSITESNNPDSLGDYTLLAQLLGTVSGGMFGIMKNDWGAIVQAVSADTNSNILATPSITTLDNEEAYFLVGQEVPVITGSQTGSNNSNPFQTVDRQEVGIKLLVTPQINEGNSVQLTIEQEVSSVSGSTGVDISINKREIKTTVMVESGQTVILGGLIDEDVQESVQKVPLLGDIPIIGHLFKSTSNSTRKRNLMVFLKPQIITDSKVMHSMAKGKYNYIRADQLRKQEEGLSLMRDENLPILPQWNDQLALPPSFEAYQESLQKDKEAKENAESGSQGDSKDSSKDNTPNESDATEQLLRERGE